MLSPTVLFLLIIAVAALIILTVVLVRRQKTAREHEKEDLIKYRFHIANSEETAEQTAPQKTDDVVIVFENTRITSGRRCRFCDCVYPYGTSICEICGKTL